MYNRHTRTQTPRPSTVNLALHACWGLVKTWNYYYLCIECPPFLLCMQVYTIRQHATIKRWVHCYYCMWSSCLSADMMLLFLWLFSLFLPPSLSLSLSRQSITVARGPTKTVLCDVCRHPLKHSGKKWLIVCDNCREATVSFISAFKYVSVGRMMPAW